MGSTLTDGSSGDFMRAVERIIKAIAYFLVFLAGISLLLMMAQTTLDVILNNLINKPIEGNLEVISVYHMVIIVFLPLAFVELRHEHINSDLLVRTFSARWRRATYVLGALVTLLFLGIMFWQSWLDALQSFAISEVIMGSIYVPVWPVKFALPAGFLGFMLVVFLNLLYALTKPDFDPTPPPATSDDQSVVTP